MDMSDMQVSAPDVAAQKQSDDWRWQPPVPCHFTPPPELIACRRVRGAVMLREHNIQLPDNVKRNMAQHGVKFLNPLVRVSAVGPDVKMLADGRPVEVGDLAIIAPGIQMYHVYLHEGVEFLLVHQKGLLGAIAADCEFAKQVDIDPRNPYMGDK